jgi:hypothetical protein
MAASGRGAKPKARGRYEAGKWPPTASVRRRTSDHTDVMTSERPRETRSGVML